VLKKVLLAGAVALWLLLSPLIFGALAQDEPNPEPAVPELSSPASPSPELLPTESPLESPSLEAPAAEPTSEALPTEGATSESTIAPMSPSPTPISTPDASRQETEAATETSPIDTGDTGFMLICSALVLLMTPGLAFFYGGLVRSRNVLNTMMMSLLLMALVGVTWTLWGYTLAFAPLSVTSATGSEASVVNASPIIGSLKWLLLNNVAFDQPDPVGYAPTIPHQVFMVYQMMFAIITPALISGAIVERISFKAYFWFIILWSSFIYAPLAHWVWGKGWIGAMGALDFAGGTVVHISSGVSAVVAAWMIGPRQDFMSKPHAPHNVPYVLLGIGLLWFGWFGFNAGSALGTGGSSGLAVVAFVATMVATAAGGLTWMLWEWILRGKPTAVGIATGFLAGLVGVTPAAGYVTPIGAILIGSITAICCFYAVTLRAKWQFDDSLDTYPVHGVGGTIGAILTGVFATKTVNGAGDNGLLFGNPAQLFEQIVGVVATYIFAAVGTWVILKILGAFMELRVKSVAEEQGLDINEHGEEGYAEEFSSRLSVIDQ
jgi:Amt family ammonium transporter